VRRFMMLGTAVFFLFAVVHAQEKHPPDSPNAAKTRKKLKEKVSVDYDNTAIREVQADLKSQIEGLPVRIDFKGGVSGNLTITYKADKKTLEEVLDGMLKKKGGLGFYIESNAKSSEDGTLWITNRPNERGYRASDEADTSSKNEKSDAKTAKKDKSKSKAKDADEAKEKKSAKEKAENADKAEDDPDKAEQDAARKLNLAKILLDDGKTDKAKARFEEIVAKFPKTKAADQARDLLKKMDK
jgi:hypothetical protein